ncbi:MAG: hypothetical protein ACR2PT_00355 [Endozoicomonas sp.]
MMSHQVGGAGTTPQTTTRLQHKSPPSSAEADRKVSGRSVRTQFDPEINLPRPDRSGKRLAKKLKDFFIRPLLPRSQVNPRFHTVHTNAPVQVWSNNPNTRVTTFQGALPGNWPVMLPPVPFLGPVVLQPLTVVYESHQPFPSIYRQPPPPVASQPQWQTMQTRPKGKVFHHIYQDAAARLKISQQRVSARFHKPTAAAANLESRSRNWKSYASRVNGLNSTVGKLKSRDYGKLAEVIKQHQQSLARPLSNKPGNIKASGEARICNLEEGMKTIDIMLGHRQGQGQGGAYFAPEERSMLLEIRAGLDRERSLTLQVMDDHGAKDLHGQIDWQTATEFKRTGYDLNFSLVEAMTPLKDSDILPDSEEQVGAGLYHSVSKQVYTPATGDPVEKIFKAEDSFDRSSYQNLVGTDKYLDKSRPRFAARNLAAQKLQNTLGLKLLPEMALTCQKGKVGLLMDVAKGKQPYNPKTGVARDIPFDAADKPEIAAKIQKNLIDAEWLDCLCGQQDRHPGNYFIDTETGQVTMIDNDQAFYPGQDKIENPAPNRRMGNWTPPWPGLPALIDKQTFESLLALDEKKVERDLTGLLEKREISSTISRLRQLKLHALNLHDKDRVVDDWLTWRSQEPPPEQVADFLKHKARPQSYFNRAVSDRDRAIQHPPRQQTTPGK